MLERYLTSAKSRIQCSLSGSSRATKASNAVAPSPSNRPARRSVGTGRSGSSEMSMRMDGAILSRPDQIVAALAPAIPWGSRVTVLLESAAHGRDAVGVEAEPVHASD